MHTVASYNIGESTKTKATFCCKIDLTTIEWHMCYAFYYLMTNCVVVNLGDLS